MNIIVPSYEILNFETESLVISDMGVVKVHSQPLLAALRQLKVSNVTTRAEFDALLSGNGLNPKSAFDFLESVIPFRTVEDVYFEKTVVVHAWKGRTDFEGLFTQELAGALEFVEFSSDVVASTQGLRCFVVLLCHSYDYDQVKKIHFDLAKASPQSAISVCWPMGGFFCIGQPYIAEIGNPCHFCTVDRLINNESIKRTKNNWASVLEFCRNKHVNIPSKALSLYEETVVIGAIIKRIKFFTELGVVRKYQDDILYVSYVQLSDGKVFEESNSHWCMCDCLGVGNEKYSS
ncbi:McbB family protein [Pseudomonas extremaustralis]|uniref:McbB family protein n=1 Tax=Pseudomonas extremaustralis TaxID=359110 RepID=UPI00099D2F56|nr:McbB family protein [Pseudomonas extremaustralis]SKB01969.1 McbB family protein [Pseudomonas extremaustralis]